MSYVHRLEELLAFGRIETECLGHSTSEVRITSPIGSEEQLDIVFRGDSTFK